MTSRSSVTAEYMALFRALESSRASGPRLFFDPDSILFLTGVRKWLGRLARLPAGLRLVESLLDRGSPGARAAGIARTKWIDEQATDALKTASQLVLLGAGFDMRAIRLPQAAHARAFELDHPQTSLAKQTILKKAQRPMAERIQYVGVDFNRQSIIAPLLQAGFDVSRPACWIWEGVTNYLSGEAVDSVLRQIAGRAASGSVLVFTYVDQAVIDNPERYYGAQRLANRLTSYGEPWTFGIDPGQVKTYLGTRGFELIRDVDVVEIWKDLGRPRSETRGYEFYRVACGRVVQPPLS